MNRRRNKLFYRGVFCLFKKEIVIAGDEQFVGMRLLPEPIEKIKYFAPKAAIANIAGMNQHVGFGQAQAAVAAMRIGNGNNLQRRFAAMYSITVPLKNSPARLRDCAIGVAVNRVFVQALLL